MRPHLTFVKQNLGFSITELLLVTAMVSVIAGFVVVSLVRANRTTDRTNTELDYLQPPDKKLGVRFIVS